MRTTVAAFLLISVFSTTDPLQGIPPSGAAARFISAAPESLRSYQALRYLEARNDRFHKSGWLEVRTTYGPKGFAYEVIAEGGAEYIRRKVLHAALDGERRLLASSEVGALNEANYTFADSGVEGGNPLIRLMPRRKDKLLVDGYLLVTPDTSDLIEVRGRLVKSPSFWVTRVEVLRRYGRVAGVRVPLLMESTASVRLAGASRFSMRYVYESVNDRAATP
jgi:hypothetical protein